jgi:hypothetical protein
MKLNVNLRDELEETRLKDEISNNSKISDTKMLLATNEANRISVLNALGLNSGIKEYVEVKRRSLDREKLENEYGKDIFHIDEIEKLCLKYDLRFLNSKHYNGNITNDLPEKVIEFSQKHNVRVGINNDTWSGDGDKFYILGPRNKFDKNRSKKEKVKDNDPILFYHTDRDYYKVVYAWGNSLSMFRLIKGWRRLNLRNRFLFISSIISLLTVSFFGAIGLNFIGSFLLGIGFAMLISLIFLPWNDGLDYNSNFFTENGWNHRDIHF